MTYDSVEFIHADGQQGYYLVGRDTGAQFTGWTLAGNFMGEHHPDTVRRIYNEGGLYGEVRWNDV